MRGSIKFLSDAQRLPRQLRSDDCERNLEERLCLPLILAEKIDLDPIVTIKVGRFARICEHGLIRSGLA